METTAVQEVRFMFKLLSAALAGALSIGVAPALAVTDAADDFLATYTGPQAGDLDILSASAIFDGTSFHLSATLSGAPGTTAGGIYVWGINRGAGAPRLTFGSPSIGAGVLFDAVAVMFPDGLGRVAILPAMGPPAITNLPGLVDVDGNTISASFATSLLPGNGFAPVDYTYTLWSRARVNPLADGSNAEVADFTPGFQAEVPEPGAWAVMILGFAGAGSALRRRRRGEVV
jgi:hypothetical protein